MRRAAAALGAAFVLTACGEKAADFATWADAVSAGVIAQGRLPAALPASAALIRVERDADRASGYFHFSTSDYVPMTGRFSRLDRLPDDPAMQNWIKRKDLAGYAAYTVSDEAGRWLLMCAQNKGRCYFRRLS
jgi:hypothetical protein